MQASEEEIQLKFHQRGREEGDKYLSSERETARPAGRAGFSEGRVMAVSED